MKKDMKNYNKKQINNAPKNSIIYSILTNFTLNKFIAGLITIIFVAGIKYMISGNLTFNLCDFKNNVVMGLSGWTINTGSIGWLTDYLGAKGNLNLYELLFGLDKAKLGDKSYILEDKKPKLYNAMDAGEGSSRGPNNNSGTAHNVLSGSRLGTPQLSDQNYWKSQLKIYEDALSALNKSNLNLTSDEIYAKNQLYKIKEFNKEAIENSIEEVKRNISFPTNDPEMVRLENVRLNLSRDAELRSKSYLLQMNNSHLLSSAKTKLESLAEFNRKNHKARGITSSETTSFKASTGIDPLTDAELKSVVDKINSDPNARHLKDKVAEGKIHGSIGPNHPIIKYLESLEKK
jgi:hypothetical protein